MIICDMDGTLLCSNHIISFKSKEILKKLKEMGKIIVIATGRSVNSAMKYLSDEFVDYLLANNGAIWYSLREQKIVKKNLLDTKDCMDILKNYKDCFLSIYVMDLVEGYYVMNVEDALDIISQNQNIVCLSIHCRPEYQCASVATQLMKEYPNLYIELMQDSFSEEQWVKVYSKENDKGSNIIKLKEYLSYRGEDIICFGDGLNDVEMLKCANIGVAMGNALQEVKNVANEITTSNDEDGIYKFLEQYYFD